jgi:hypothetical protein
MWISIVYGVGFALSLVELIRTKWQPLPAWATLVISAGLLISVGLLRNP